MSDNNISVLIVEDIPWQRRSMAEWLERKLKATVVTCETGGEALDLVQKAGGKFDVVILDQVLPDPDLDGIDVMRRIKADFPGIQVIMCTGQDVDAGIEALMQGAYRYIIKPVNLEEIAILVRHVSDIREMEQRLLKEGDLIRATRQTAEQVLSVSKEQLLQEVVTAGQQLLDVPVCIFWELDRSDGFFKIAAWAGEVGEEFRLGVRLDSRSKAIDAYLRTREPVFLPDIQEAPLYEHREEAKAQGWVSLLSAPMILQERVVGILDAYTHHRQSFTPWQKELLATFAAQASIAIRQASLARHLQEVSRLALGRDTAPLADYVAGAVHDLTGLWVAMWLLDEKDPVLRIRAHRGLREEYVRTAITPLAGSITAAALRQKQPLWRRDIQHDDQAPPFGHPEEAHAQGWRFFLCAPLLTREGEPLGSLSLYGPRPEECSEAQLMLVWTFANQVAIALENVQLLHREQRLRKEADTYRQMSKAIASADELEQLTQGILDRLYDIVEYRTASLQLVRGDYRVLLDGRGFDREAADRYLVRPISKDPLVRRVIDSKQPLILPNTEDEPAWGRAGTQPAVNSWICVPLIHDREVIGLLTADHDQPGYYRPELEDTLAEFGRAIVDDVRNARIFDSTQRRIRDLEIIHDVSEMIGAKLNTDDLLQAIVENVAQRLECTHCTVFFPEQHGDERFLVPRKTFGERSEVIKTRKFKPDEGLVGWVFQNGASIVLPNAKEDYRFASARRELGQPRSMLVVPVKVGDQTIGVICADQDEYGWFGESERSLVETLAQQAGIAIQRSIALDQMRAIGEQTLHAPNLGAILKQVVRGAIELTNSTAGVIYLLDEEGWEIVGQFEHPPTYKHPEPRLRQGGITRRIFETGTEMIFPDVRLDPAVNPEVAEHFCSMIGVPLKIDEHVIGVLFLNDTQVHHFNETEVSLLKTLAGQAAVAIQNRQYYDNLELLNATGARLTGLLDEREILSLVASLAARTFNCTHCTVFRLEGESLVVAASVGNRGDSVPEGRSFPANEGIAGWVAQQGQAAFVPNTSLDERFAPGWSRPLPDPASLIVAPIVADAGTYGVISAEHDRSGAFRGYDKDLLGALAYQAGQAVRNARLFKSLQSRIDDLRTLNTVGQLISRELHIDRLLELLLENVNRTLGCRYSTLFQVNAAGELEADVRRDALEQNPDRTDLTRIRRYGMGVGLAGWVAQHREPLNIPDVDQDERALAGQTIRPGSPHSMLLAPMLLPGNKVVGVLSADKEELNGFDDNDQLLLETMAAQAAIAIENARLYRHIEQDLDRKIGELQVLTEIGKSVSNVGVDDILDLVYEQASRVMDLSDAQVQFAFYDEERREVSFPLAVEQDKERGGIIDRVRWGKREAAFVLPGESELVQQLQTRPHGDRYGLTEFVISERKPKLIPENFFQAAEQLTIAGHPVEVWRTFGRYERPTHSWMGVPMKVHDRVTGIISIQSLEIECAFDEGHMSLLETVANQAAVAIENGRLLAKERDRVEQLAALHEIGVKLTASLDFQDVMGSIADNTNRILHSDFTTIFPYSEERGFGEGARAGTVSARPSLPRARGFAYHVLEAGKIVPVPDAGSYDGLKPEFVADKDVQSFIGIPLKFRDKPVGIVLANYHKRHVFTDDEVGLATQIAALAAVAIENATRAEMIANRERYMTVLGLAADLVHRINNRAGTIPLRITHLEEKLVRNGASNADVLRVLDNIRRDVRGLLEESRQVEGIEENPVPPEPGPVSVADRLATIASRLELESPDDIEVLADIEPDLMPVRALPEELDHALWSVAFNGVQAMVPQKQGALTIRARMAHREDGDWVRIEIADQGPGIPADIRPLIFEPFYSTGSGPSRGFGLWRARQVFRKLGGTIELAAIDRPGTTFVITLPAMTADDEAQDAD